MDRKPMGSLQRGAAAGRIVDATPDTSPETADVLRRLELVAHWLDGAFRLPGTSWRFGLDGILGLVPGAGDSLTAVVGAYIILEAWRLGVPSSVIVRMLGNIGVDWAVGSVPLVGDIFDFAFKSHRRNVDLLRRHLSERPR
jgi:hypothetical protein